MTTVARPWSSREDRVLYEGRTASPKVPFEQIAAKLGRSLGAVGVRAAVLGLVNERARVTPELISRALAMRAKDRSWRTIGQILSVGHDRIRIACRDAVAATPAKAPKKKAPDLANRIRCLGPCGNMFFSQDRVQNRVCTNCKATDAFSLGSAWVG